MAVVRAAQLPNDTEAVRRLWLAYLTWGNDELEARHGFRLPVAEAVEQDVVSISKFQPPDGRLLIALDGPIPIGTACLRWISAGTCEMKRMWVDPWHRRSGTGRAMLDRLIAEAGEAGYVRMRLDSPDFMTAAHELYYSRGFRDTPPYSGTDVPEAYWSYWMFMEKSLP
jgi:GNAT superfamily N-acetyltransferase